MSRSGYYKCRLTNKSMNGHTRTTVIEGMCDAPPEPGFRFTMWNDQPLVLDRGARGRIIQTSEVKQVSLVGSNVDFITESGTNYFWENIS